MATRFQDLRAVDRERRAGTISPGAAEIQLRAAENLAGVGNIHPMGSAAARETGLPLVVASDNLDEIERRRRLARDVAAMDQNPRLQRFLGNPVNAAASRGQVPDMARISRMFGDAVNQGTRAAASPNAWTWTRGIVQSAGENLLQSGLGMVRSELRGRAHGGTSLPGMVAGDPLSQWGYALALTYVDPVIQRLTTGSQRRVEEVAPVGIEDQPWYVSGGYSGAISLLTMAPALVVARRNPVEAGRLIARPWLRGVAMAAPATGILSAQTYGQSYSTYSARGVGHSTAQGGALADATIEAATEIVPMAFAARLLNGGGLLRNAGKYLLSDVAGEQIATLGQEAVDITVPGSSSTWAEYTDPAHRLRRAGETLIGTLIATGGIGGYAAVERAVRGGARDIDRAMDAADRDARMDRIIGIVEQMGMGANDPRALADFLNDQAQETGVDTVSIDARTIRELFQDYRTDDFFGAYADQIDRATELEGEIVLPIGDAIAGLSQNGRWDTLRDTVRLSPGGMTPAEAKSLLESYKADGDRYASEITEDAERQREEMQPVRMIYDDIFSQVRAAGMGTGPARRYAELTAQRYRARAERRGVGEDPFDLYKASLAAVRGGTPVSVRRYREADNLDVLIEAMRRPRDEARRTSLLEWISRRGGVTNDRGELKTLGLDQWHRERGGRRKLIREGKTSDQQNSLDTLALDAWEAGYFPDMAERPTVNDMLEAMDREARGDPVYTRDDVIDRMWAAAEELRSFLDAQGIDVATATREEIEAATAEIVATGRVLSQGDQARRGSIELTDNGAIINLFENADLSTMLHEMGHLWLEELREDASFAGSPEALKADWAAVEAWLAQAGYKQGEPIPTQAHELWARGMERYFMEGKPPSNALRSAFDRFRSWLLRIYSVVGNLNSPINDDIRRVMDRLLATEAEIEEASAQNELLPQDALGWSDEEYAAYTDLFNAARTEAMDALLFRTMDAVRKRRTKEWREAAKPVRTEMEEQVRARPEFRALRLLRGVGGERVQLSRAYMLEMFGQATLDLFPRGVPPTVVEKGGVDPQVLAEMSGFATAREMVDMLVGIEMRTRELRAQGSNKTVEREEVDRLVEQAMSERFGDILADGTIEEEALAAIHEGRYSEVIAAEARALGKKVGERPSPREAARAWAERRVLSGRVADEATAGAIARHRRNELKARRAAERAILDNSPDEAFRQKQLELYHHELFRAASAAKERIDTIIRRLGRFANARGFKGLDPEYFDRISELLEAFDFKPRTQRDIKDRQSFAAWAASREAAGEDVVIPARLADFGLINFTRLAVEDLYDLDDAVQNLNHLGRRKETLRDGKERRDLKELVAEARVGAEVNKGRKWRAERNERKDIRQFARKFDASLIKADFLTWFLDGKFGGVFNRVLIRPATEAANTRDRLMNDVFLPIARLYDTFSREQAKRLNEFVTVPELLELDETDRENPQWVPTKMMRRDILAIALNTGNASNLWKLIEGENMARPANQPLEQNALMAMLERELNASEWQFVQAIWDNIDTLWPAIRETERELTGLTPERVEAREFANSHGTFRGGYYPAVFDPRVRKGTPDWVSRMHDKADDDAGKRTPTISRTRKGHTETRTSAAAPLYFSLDGVLLKHVQDVTTRIAYGEFERDARKFLNDSRIKRLVSEKFGPEYHKMLDDWISWQVSESATTLRTLEGVNAVLRGVRMRATIVGLGFRISTILVQLGGSVNAMGKVGVANTLKGYASYMRGGIPQAVFARSEEMAGRVRSFDRDFRQSLERMSAEGDSKAAKVRAYGMMGIGYTQLYGVDIPVFMGAYEARRAETVGAMTEEESEADAVAYAEQMVRMTQSGGRAKDLSAIQAGPEGYKLTTMFYSFFNVLYNTQREIAHDVRHGRIGPASRNTAAMLMVGPVLSALLVGDWEWPEDDENAALHWGEFALRKIGFGLFAGLPWMRDAASKAERELAGKYAGDPVAPAHRAIEETLAPFGDLMNLIRGEEVSDRWLKHAIIAPGYAFNLPLGQPATTAQYLFDLSKGEQNPETAGDVLYGVMRGPQEEQE